VGLLLVLYPNVGAAVDEVTVPHEAPESGPSTPAEVGAAGRA
jgi:hypothetical protein